MEQLDRLLRGYNSLQNKVKQTTYLMGLIMTVQIKRRQHGTYESPEGSRCQCTVNHVLPDGKGDFLQVCRKTFEEASAVTKKAVGVLIEKK